MRCALTLAALVFVAVPTTASAAGPVLSGEYIRTSLTHAGDERYEGLQGGGYKVGFEIGSGHVRNEFGFDQSFLTGDGEGYHHRLTLTGVSYQLSVLFWPKGFTPYVGAGVEVGLATMRESGYPTVLNGGVSYDGSEDVNTGYYLRPYLVGGLRIPIGKFAIKGELAASYYYDFFALNTTVSISYTW
jgi:hypothetical protein